MDWTESGHASSEMTGEFSFEALHGEGLYQFKTIAEDTTGNLEQKVERDTETIIDTTAPISEIDAPDFVSTEAITISYAATDAGCSSGIVGVHLFFRSSLTEWQEAEESGEGAEGIIEFAPPDGEGWYQFYSRAEDVAGNIEAASENHKEVIYDRTAPSSSIEISPFTSQSIVEVFVQAHDATTEPAQTSLMYRFRAMDGNWSPHWAETGLYTSEPEEVLEFHLPHGQGIYELCSVSQDVCGNSEQIDGDRAKECIFDSEPPTSILNGPAAVNTAAFELEFSSSDSLSGVSNLELLYSIDGGEVAPTGIATESTSGQFQLDDIAKEGIYTFICLAEDLAGNSESPNGSNSAIVHVDFEPPSSNAVAPKFANRLPVVVECYATDSSIGTGAARIELYYRFDDEDWEFSGLSQEASTRATFSFAINRGDGTYGFFCLATDAAGNQEAMKTEADSELLIDSNRPDSHASCGLSHTKPPVDVAYAATAATCEIASVALWYRYSDGSNWTDWADSGFSENGVAGVISFEPAEGDGTYEFYTLAEDECGNSELGPGIADCTAILDTNAPTCSVVTPEYSNTNSIDVQYECVDGPKSSGIGEIVFWYRKQGGEWQLHPTKGYGEQGELTLRIDLGEGTYDLAALATDLAGNTGGSLEEPGASFTLDFMKPSSMSACLRYTQVATISVEVHSSDALSGIDCMRLFKRKEGGDWAQVGSPIKATSASLDVALDLGKGRYEFRTCSTDRACNEESLSDTVECYTIYDTTAPTSTCSAPPYAKDATVEIAFEASDDYSGIGSVTLWASYGSAALAAIDTVNGKASGTFLYTFASGEGRYRFAVQAVDAAGNSQGKPTTYQRTVLYDSTVPQTNCQSPASSKSTPIAISFSATDSGSGIAQVELYYRHNDSTWKDSGLNSTSGSGTLSFAPPDGDGEYRFCIIATDKAGNESDLGTGMDTTVFDMTPPEVSLSCPEASTTSPIPVQFEAHDAVSDVTQVTLYYRFRADGGTRAGTWKSYTYARAGSGTFTFIPGHGFGIYEFTAIGIDSLNNIGKPGDDALCYVSYEASIPVISPSDVSHDFGEAAIGNSKSWALKIENTGGSALVISELSTSGEFTCPAMTPITIQARGTYQLEVRFVPEEIGKRDGWLMITSNDTNSPNYNISLTGTGFDDDADPVPTIVMNATAFKAGDRLMAQVEAEYYGQSEMADLYVSVFLPGDVQLYWPGLSAIPTPFISSIQLYPGYRLPRTTIVDLTLPELEPGQYSFMASFCLEGTVVRMGTPEIKSFTIDAMPTLELSLNTSEFEKDDLMSLSRTIVNPGAAKSVDLYIGVTFPTGETLFYPTLSEMPEPFTTSIPLQDGQTIGPDEVFKITMPEIMPGTYYWLAALTPAGEFNSFSNIPSCAWSFKASKGTRRSPMLSMSFDRFPKPDDN
ncbi:MAG: choice-of-anchor D domain-containing protein [Candidatus Coatesbacteria bacterium]|nr:choice-of-anchor D domain-containing protein [Candidatus Coatesbacteria bacterium]